MELTKVYITKYALTSGIIEAEMRVKDNGNSCYGKPKGYYYETGFYGNDFFLNKEEALQNCENRRLRKIESLKKQIEKISKKKF